MKFSTCWIIAPLLAASACHAQPAAVLHIAPPQKLVVKRGAEVSFDLKLTVDAGYHVNSNAPSEDYMIPLRLTWEPGALESAGIKFPEPQLEKYAFAEKPLAVYSGSFTVTTKFKRGAKAAPGPAYVLGKLRYQACNDKMCLPPRTLDVRLPVLLE